MSRKACRGFCFYASNTGTSEPASQKTNFCCTIPPLVSLTIGTKIGPYEIHSSLGEGGMGVVFRAHDTKLGRDVAVKVLSDAFANDPDRLARFEREAQVLASLNHANIAHIYG